MYLIPAACDRMDLCPNNDYWVSFFFCLSITVYSVLYCTNGCRLSFKTTIAKYLDMSVPLEDGVQEFSH